MTLDQPMKNALIGSGLLHLVVLILATVGLPFISPKPIENTPINTINIEFINPEEISQTDKAPEIKLAPPKDIKTTPPKMTAEAAPDLSKPKEPEIEETPPPEEAEPVPLPEEIKPPQKIAKPLPPKPKITKRAQPKKDDSADFQSLLKNLIPDAETQRQPTPPETVEEPTDNTPVANLADRLTVSEIDAVRAQLAGCWNVMSGARMAEDLIVPVKLYMNPDRTVRKAVIMDQSRYNADSFYRAAADSALRALRQPACSPLLLPEGKFEEWKTTIINFDPRSML